MNKKIESQQMEHSNRQAVEVLKALSHFQYPEEVSQVQSWLEKTKPLQSLVKTFCERDKSGRLTLECVYVLFDLMASHGEAISPAIWEILDIVEEDKLKFLLKLFLKESTPRLKNCLCALVSGVCMHGQRLVRLQVWCYAFIQALEEKQKYHVLLSVSQEVAFKLLHGIILPHTRETAFSLFERLLYPMIYPHVFHLLVDQLPEVLPALEKDALFERFRGLINTLLKRFPPTVCTLESYNRLKIAMGKYLEGEYNSNYSIWNYKSNSTTQQTSKLSKILECPVCYERFVTPITACVNGHCICNNCKDRVSNCPICRDHFSNIRMTILDQIMEMTEFLCKNFDAGCPVKLPYKYIWNHEIDCEYRTMSCDIITSQNPPKLLCNEDVVVAHFHRHIENFHKASVAEFELNSERKGELSRQRANEIKLLKNSDGNLNFIERIYVTDEEIFFSYHYVGKSEDANNYVYTLKINGNEIPQKIKYSNFCLPNYMGVFDTEADERCLILEPEKLFFTEQAKLHYSVKIEDVNVYRMRLKKNKFLVSN